MPEFNLPFEQALRQLNISRSTLRKLVADKRIECRNRGLGPKCGRFYFRAEDIAQLKEKLEVGLPVELGR